MLDYAAIDEIESDQLLDRNNKICENGLLSQRIFGPMKNYKCACGEYSSKVLYSGKRCPKCKVLCTTSESRSKTFAKITLPYPIYRYSKLNELLKIVGKKYASILNPKLRDMSTSTEIYLRWDINTDALMLRDTYHQNTKTSNIVYIPFPVIGTYSLYVALMVVEKLGSISATKYVNYFQSTIPVLPPNSRPSVISGGGSDSKYIHDMDQLYMKLLHKRNYLVGGSSQVSTFSISDLISTISKSVYNVSPVILDDMVMHEFEQCTLQYYSNDIYSTALGILSGKEGLIRNDFLGKVIDFSARAVISPNPTIQPYQIKIPVWIFIKLWFIEYLWYLSNVEDICIDNAKEIMRNADGIKKSTNYIDEFISHFFDTSDVYKRLIFINRQPTLWRFGAPVVEIVGISNGDTIETNPIFLDPLNGDYDGDTVALYRIHDKAAQYEMEQNAFVLNTIKYDHNSLYLHTLKDETVYYLKTFTETVDEMTHFEDFKFEDIEITSDFISLFSATLSIDGDKYTIGTCLVNIAAGFNGVYIRPGVGKNQISNLIFNDSRTNGEYFSRISKLSNFLNNCGLLLVDDPITLPIEECARVNNIKSDDGILQNLPNHPIVGYLLYRASIANISKKMSTTSALAKFRKTKFKEIQFSRSLVSVGYISDHNNITSGRAIKNSTFGGLNEDEFFRTAYGSRKGITDKHKVVPDSGYLERSMVMNFSAVEICEDDCGAIHGLPIIIKNELHAKSLVGRYCSADGTSNWIKLDDKYAYELIGSEIILRSPIMCMSPNYKICKKCFGDTSTPGPFVGILAGQYIAERMTQLAMRTFHTSGSATYTFSDELVEFFSNHVENVTNHTDHFTVVLDERIRPTLKTELTSKCKDTYIKDRSDATTLVFNNLPNCENEDVTTILKIVESQFKSKHKLENSSIRETYEIILMNMLSLGFIYSVFIEVALCNSFISKSEKVFRYALQESIDTGCQLSPVASRMNVRSIHTKISPLLSLLYVPNSKTIYDINMGNIIGLNRSPEVMTIYERIWLSEL